MLGDRSDVWADRDNTDDEDGPVLARTDIRVGQIAENLFHEFATLGIDVLIADMPTYNGKDRKDVLVRQIREAIAEENRKEIIERLWKGRRERVHRGLPPAGTAPYGYRRDGRRLVVDQAEAGIIQLVFEFADRGCGGSAIARALNEKGLVRRNGKAWTQRQVAAALKHERLYRQGMIQYGEVVGRNASLVLLG
jgi:DNA invertase Pin-like site-specific DNA recombinase